MRLNLVALHAHHGMLCKSWWRTGSIDFSREVRLDYHEHPPERLAAAVVDQRISSEVAPGDKRMLEEYSHQHQHGTRRIGQSAVAWAIGLDSAYPDRNLQPTSRSEVAHEDAPDRDTSHT